MSPIADADEREPAQRRVRVLDEVHDLLGEARRVRVVQARAEAVDGEARAATACRRRAGSRSRSPSRAREQRSYGW